MSLVIDVRVDRAAGRAPGGYGLVAASRRSGCLCFLRLVWPIPAEQGKRLFQGGDCYRAVAHQGRQLPQVRQHSNPVLA